MRILLKNGTVCDGTGTPCRQADVLIEGERIAEVKENIAAEQAQEIDVSGCVVTPGFVDTHRHCDIDAVANPDFGRIEARQGLTSVVGGNCGLAPFPVGNHAQEIADYIEPCLGMLPDTMRLNDFADYLKMLDSTKKPVNVGSYVGLGTLKASIKGYGRGAFTAAEMEQAQTYLREALAQGALGMTAGIMYQPECYSTEEEYVELLRTAAASGKPLACHIRGEGDNLVSSVAEIIRIAEKAGIPLNISHFKATGEKNWGRNIYQAIELIDAARARGQDVTVDFYPYDGGSTTLVSLLPPTLVADTMEQTLRGLSTDEGRKRAVQEIYKEHLGWDNMVTAIGWERIIISSVSKAHNKRFATMDFASAAKLAGFDEPVDFLCELMCDEQGKVGIILLSMSSDDVDTVAKLPYSMLISDALYGVSDCPHPRLYGSFPKFLADSVYKRKVVTLEQAVHKMTQMPAQRLLLQNRGVLQSGAWADICVFRPQELASPAEYANPRQLCTGFKAVYINGRAVVQEDRFCAEGAGTTLRTKN